MAQVLSYWGPVLQGLAPGVGWLLAVICAAKILSLAGRWFRAMRW